MADETAIADLSFEDAMREFDRVVSSLEGGDVPLEQMISLYERGSALKAHCDAKLKAAEEKIARITRDSDGTPVGTAPLDE